MMRDGGVIDYQELPKQAELTCGTHVRFAGDDNVYQLSRGDLGRINMQCTTRDVAGARCTKLYRFDGYVQARKRDSWKPHKCQYKTKEEHVLTSLDTFLRRKAVNPVRKAMLN
jgi:hypothetical protein